MSETPSQFSSPPRPPRREIDFGVIGEAFTIQFKHFGVYLVSGLLMFVLFVPYTIYAFLPFIGLIRDGGSLDPMMGVPEQIGCLVAAQLLCVIFYPGVVKYTFNLTRGLPASKSDLWEGFRDPLGYLAVGIVSDLIGLLGVAFCCVGAFVTTAFMMFAVPIKVDTGKRAWQCITESWELVKPNWLAASGFMFIALLISQIGSSFCWIGMAVTLPYPYIAAALMYDRYMGRGVVDETSPYTRGEYPRERSVGEMPPPPEPPVSS